MLETRHTVCEYLVAVVIGRSERASHSSLGALANTRHEQCAAVGWVEVLLWAAVLLPGPVAVMLYQEYHTVWVAVVGHVAHLSACCRGGGARGIAVLSLLLWYYHTCEL